MDKGDCHTLSELTPKLTLEDSVEAFVDIYRRFGCPSGFKMELMRSFDNHDGDIAETAAAMFRPPDNIRKYLVRLAHQYGVKSLEELLKAIRAFLCFLRKLGIKSDFQLDWLSTWRDKHFDRKQTAVKLFIRIDALKKRISTLKHHFRHD